MEMTEESLRESLEQKIEALEQKIEAREKAEPAKELTDMERLNLRMSEAVTQMHALREKEINAMPSAIQGLPANSEPEPAIKGLPTNKN